MRSDSLRRKTDEFEAKTNTVLANVDPLHNARSILSIFIYIYQKIYILGIYYIVYQNKGPHVLYP